MTTGFKAMGATDCGVAAPPTVSPIWNDTASMLSLPIPSGRVFYFLGVLLAATAFACEYAGEQFEKLQKVTRTVLATAWTLANAPDRPHLDHGATR